MYQWAPRTTWAPGSFAPCPPLVGPAAMPSIDIAVNEAVNEFGILTLARPDTQTNEHLADSAQNTFFELKIFKLQQAKQNLQVERKLQYSGKCQPGQAPSGKDTRSDKFKP